MKKSICLLLFLLVCRIGYSQQKPQYTQYIFNNFLLNPAVAGIENYIDVKTGYRSQWTGLDGAPVTTYVSAHMPLGKNYLYGNANSFSGKGDNPMSRSYKQNYMAAEPHHGAGIQAVVDKAGPFQRMDISGSYAYHIGISEKVNASAGISAGIVQVQLDRSKISLENENDNALSNNPGNRIVPDLAAGIWVYGPDFFAGISAGQLAGGNLSFSDNAGSGSKLVPHFFITGGYKLFLSEDIAAIPSFMLKWVEPVPTSVDINGKLAFRDKLWIGGGYRNDQSFSAMAGFNVSYLFNISYSYDFPSSDIQIANRSSHEVVLGILLNNRYRVTCPERQF